MDWQRWSVLSVWKYLKLIQLFNSLLVLLPQSFWLPHLARLSPCCLGKYSITFFSDMMNSIFLFFVLFLNLPQLSYIIPNPSICWHLSSRLIFPLKGIARDSVADADSLPLPPSFCFTASHQSDPAKRCLIHFIGEIRAAILMLSGPGDHARITACKPNTHNAPL